MASVVVALLGSLALASAQPRRLRIINGCGSEPLWIAHEAAGGIGPDGQNVKIEPMASHDFLTPDGLAATRYWGKMRCDGNGNGCRLGGSGGPGEACVHGDDYSRCAPPLDTKFEATFGVESQDCNPQTGQMQGCDYVDVSLVDGFTLPFKLELAGHCTGRGDEVVPRLDCSGLSLSACPAGEQLGAAGTASLRAAHPGTGEVVGCYSPCLRLIDDKWSNPFSAGRHPEDPVTAPYCCPTPPQSPDSCRAGPVKDTAYVRGVHAMCPGVYAYSYDDAMGLLRCKADTRYELTFFCPLAPPAGVVRLDDAAVGSVTGGVSGSGRFAAGLAARAAALAALAATVVFTAVVWRWRRRPHYSQLVGREIDGMAVVDDGDGGEAGPMLAPTAAL